MKAEVKVVGDRAELFLNGEKVTRMSARAALPGRWAPSKVDQYEHAGIDIYLTAIDHPYSVCWDGAEGYDYAPYDTHVKRLVERKPDIKLILYVGFRGGSPYLWNREHVDQLVLLSNGQRLMAPSLASEVWREDSVEALKRFVEHFENGPYADNIIGYNPILSGNEWFGWSWKAVEPEDGFDDFSEPMRRHFREWLRDRYGGDVEQLRDSWKDNDVTFETAEIPSVEERLMVDDPSFFPCCERGNQVADYFRCYNEASSELTIAYCRAVKEAAPVPKLAGVMHGYSYCGRFMHGYPQHHGSGAAQMLMESEWIDFLQAPYAYYNRPFGGVHYSQQAPDSVLVHDKLFLDQTDTKTYLVPLRRDAETKWESVQILKRDLSYPLSKNSHCYWLEGGPGTMFPIEPFGGTEWSPLWYDDDDLKDLISSLKDVIDENQAAGTEPASEVALITSNESMYYRKLERAFGPLFVEGLRQYILPEVGAPFDDYMLEDFENIERSYKVYIFPNALYVSSERREAIRTKLEEDGATAIWFYAPGYVDETGCDVEHMAELTGIDIALETLKEYLQVDLAESDHPYLADAGDVDGFGSDVDLMGLFKGAHWWDWPSDREHFKFSPTFYVDDEEAVALGELTAVGRPGFAVKDLGKSRSVFVGAPLLPATILRNILDEAGVHLYSRSGDLIYANSGYVTLCANGGGTKTLYLPRVCDVYDALSGELVAENVDSVSLEVQHGEVTIFRLE